MRKNNTCPRCSKETDYKEFTSDFYHLKGSSCPACGYYLVYEGWVDSMKIGKKVLQPEATS